MATFVLSRASIRKAVIARHPDGTAAALHDVKNVWAPRIYDYCPSFMVKEDREGGKNWTLVIVDAGVTIPAAADADLDVIVLPEADLDRVFGPAARAAVNTRLAVTDLGVTIDSTDTVRSVLLKLGAALRHSADFDPAEFSR